MVSISSAEIIIKKFEIVENKNEAFEIVKSEHPQKTFTEYFFEIIGDDEYYIIVRDFKNLISEEHIYAFHKEKGMCIAKYTYADYKEVIRQISEYFK